MFWKAFCKELRVSKHVCRHPSWCGCFHLFCLANTTVISSSCDPGCSMDIERRKWSFTESEDTAAYQQSLSTSLQGSPGIAGEVGCAQEVRKPVDAGQIVLTSQLSFFRRELSAEHGDPFLVQLIGRVGGPGTFEGGWEGWIVIPWLCTCSSKS